MVGDRIKAIRLENGMTQQQFADRLDMTRGAISNYEIGRNMPFDATIALICDRFGVSRRWLETGEGEMHQEVPRDEEITKYVTKLLNSPPDSFMYKLATVMAGLTEPQLKTLEQFVTAIALEFAPENVGQDCIKLDKKDEDQV